MLIDLTVLAALANAMLLFVAVGAIALEALQRLGTGETSAHGGTLMAVAGLGILVIGVTTLLFLRGPEHDLNVNVAFQHMAADAAVSIGVVLSGALILATGSAWIDPLVSLLIAALIGIGSWRLLRSSAHLAVDGVPESIDEAAVAACLANLPGVTDAHDMHFWPLSTTKTHSPSISSSRARTSTIRSRNAWWTNSEIGSALPTRPYGWSRATALPVS